MEDVSDNLSSNLLRRVVLPGAVAVLYFHPYFGERLLSVSRSYGVTELIVLLVEAAFLGLLISSSILPIFYVYEGFRFSWLTWPALKLNAHRKKTAREKLNSLYTDAKGNDRTYEQFSEKEKNKADRLTGFLKDFPVKLRNGRPTYVVDRPTILGNIIDGYESYPETRYGIDGLFFWFHLLILAPDAARKEYEEKVAFAESLVLTSATGALVAVVALCSLFGRAAGALTGKVFIHLTPPASFDWWGLAGGLIVWFIFYKLALPAHRQVRSAFQAVTDLAMPRLLRWLKAFNAPAAPGMVATANTVSEYLRFLATSASASSKGALGMAQQPVTVAEHANANPEGTTIAPGT